MNINITGAVATAAITVIIARVLFPLFIRWSPALRLVDAPNDRKLHRKPIPAIGGLVIGLSVILTTIISPVMLNIVTEYSPLIIAMLVLLVIGVLDDRLNISPYLRLAIQFGCAVLVAYNDIRLYSLHGLLGIYILPVWAQYSLTILIMVGVTNAFNLIDGIDGLAGSMALFNVLALSIMSSMVGLTGWNYILFSFSAALLVFLKYNAKQARIFMGDGGSLVFGFFLAAMGILLIRKAEAGFASYGPWFIISLTGMCMIAVVDTLRVFYSRIRKGRSPFSADKSHLHHWLIRNHLPHLQATRMIITLHVLMVLFSIGALYLMPISWVLVLQVIAVVAFTSIIQINTNFHRWYRFIKRSETHYS